MFKERDETPLDANRRINNYISFVKWFKENIKPLYELFFSNKIDLLKEPLKKFLSITSNNSNRIVWNFWKTNVEKLYKDCFKYYKSKEFQSDYKIYQLS